MNPDSLALLHGANGEGAPQLDSVEIAELDGVCVGTLGRTEVQGTGDETAGQPAKEVESGVPRRVGWERPRPIYVPYRPGAILEDGGT
jgi:hypothetical protein